MDSVYWLLVVLGFYILNMENTFASHCTSLYTLTYGFWFCLSACPHWHSFVFSRHWRVCRAGPTHQPLQERSLCEHFWLVQVLLQTRLHGLAPAKRMRAPQNSVKILVPPGWRMYTQFNTNPADMLSHTSLFLCGCVSHCRPENTVRRRRHVFAKAYLKCTKHSCSHQFTFKKNKLSAHIRIFVYWLIFDFL